jgi:hypothetical protein
MRQFPQFIFYFILSFTLCGCDYTYRHYFNVRNNTTGNITVSFIHKYGPGSDRLQKSVIPAGQEKTIYSASGTGLEMKRPPIFTKIPWMIFPCFIFLMERIH